MTTSVAQINDLIRMLDGAEAPIAGRWLVGAGQPVRFTTRGVRRRTTAGRIVAGTLDVTDGIVGSTLQLSVVPHDGARSDGEPTRDPPPPIHLTLSVSGFGADGRWRAVGAASTESGSDPLSVVIEYHGVFRHARHTALWITLDAALDRPLRGTWRPVRRRQRVETDLTLEPAAA